MYIRLQLLTRKKWRFLKKKLYIYIKIIPVGIHKVFNKPYIVSTVDQQIDELPICYVIKKWFTYAEMKNHLLLCRVVLCNTFFFFFLKTDRRIVADLQYYINQLGNCFRCF